MVSICAGCDSYYPWSAAIVSSISGVVYLVSISPTIYKQLLHIPTPKAQEDIDDLTDFLRFWDL